MSTSNFVLIDYGINNLFSVKRMIDSLGAEVRITSDPDEVRTADKVILPGVGAFAKAMEELRAKNMDQAVKEYVKTGKPLLGICLGMQLLFTESEEFGNHKGLDLIPGTVVRFTTAEDHREFKIPQMNWNSIEPHAGAKWENTLLDSIPPQSEFYFVHSYICKPDRDENFIAESHYGTDTFCAVANKDHIWGCQFHPEKSSRNGIQLLKNFIEKVR